MSRKFFYKIVWEIGFTENNLEKMKYRIFFREINLQKFLTC